MNKILNGFIAILFTVFVQMPAFSAEHSTAEKAMAMVVKGTSFLKLHNREAALAEFNKHKGPFIDGELYIFVIDKDGMTLANGVNSQLVGKNVMNMKDGDGKLFIKRLIDIGDTKSKGWLEYRWINTVTQVMEMKRTYIEKSDGMYIGCGYYR